MSVAAASIQYIRITNQSSSSSSSSSSSRCYYASNRCLVTTIRCCSQPDGPLRRPSIATPPVRPPNLPPSPPDTTPAQNVVTMEFQRQKAKELQEYFKQKKLEAAANQGPFFGFIAKNEISNGRFILILNTL